MTAGSPKPGPKTLWAWVSGWVDFAQDAGRGQGHRPVAEHSFWSPRRMLSRAPGLAHGSPGVPCSGKQDLSCFGLVYSPRMRCAFLPFPAVTQPSAMCTPRGHPPPGPRDVTRAPCPPLGAPHPSPRRRSQQEAEPAGAGPGRRRKLCQAPTKQNRTKRFKNN